MSGPLGRGGVENAVKESETVRKGFFFIFTYKRNFSHSNSDFLHLTAPVMLARSVPWFTLFVCVHCPYCVCCIHIPWWQKQQFLWSVFRCLPHCMVPCLRRQLKLAVVSLEETERPAWYLSRCKILNPKMLDTADSWMKFPEMCFENTDKTSQIYGKFTYSTCECCIPVFTCK